MVIAVTPGETWEWIHESDRDLPAEKQTVFVLRVLTDKEQRECSNRSISSDDARGKRRRRKAGGQSFRAGDYQHMLISLALVDVRNLRSKDGSVIPFEYDEIPGFPDGPRRRVKDSFLDKLPHEVKVDLASEISDGNAVDEEDLKN